VVRLLLDLGAGKTTPCGTIGRTTIITLPFNLLWVLGEKENLTESLIILSRRPRDQLATNSHLTRGKRGINDHAVRPYYWLLSLLLLIYQSFGMNVDYVQSLDVYDE
jgi:hypothetical protein